MLTTSHLATHQGYHSLVELLVDPEAEVRKAAGWAVSVLSSKPSSARDLCGCGGLQTLQEVEEAPELRTIFSSRALEGLLSTNLVAKFWTIGRLGEWDCVEDGFYEVGASSHSVEFRSLEELSKLPLSDKLTVVCINSRPEEKEEVVVKEDTAVKERSKSRKGADSQAEKKPGRKSKIEKEQKEEEEAPPESTEPPFFIPIDLPLQELVQEVTSFARSTESGREVARHIAKLVSSHMGGEVER